LTPNEKWIYEEEARKSYAEVEREKNEAIQHLYKLNCETETTVRSLDYCSCELIA